MPQPALAPVHAGVRGGGHEPAIYNIAGGADGKQVILTAQPRPAAAGRYDLLGLVAGADLTGFTAHLWQGGMPACPAAGTPAGGQAVQPCDQPAPQLVASAPVDEGGNILFTDLAAAEYELVLSGPGRQIYIEKLRI